MSNNGTREAPLPTSTRPIGAEPILDSKGVVLYRPDQLAAAVADEEAKGLATQVQALWPQDLANNARLAMTIAKVALAYKVDPFLGHLTVYRGKPFFTVEGRLQIAQNNKSFLGVAARPATDEERRSWGCANKPEIILWRAEASRSDWIDPQTSKPRIVVGWGEVNTAKDQNPVAREKPNQQAEVRATKRALRTLYTAPLPFQDAPDEADRDRDEPIGPSKWIDAASGQVLDQRPGGNLLTPGQRASIHSMCKELGIDQERRHALLYGMFGRASTSELTEGDAAAFIEWLADKLAPEVIEHEDPHAGALYAPPPAASKRFHTAAAAASFTAPRIIEPTSEPQQPNSAMAEGMILAGPGGQKFVVEEGQLIPFVEAPRETEESLPNNLAQGEGDPAAAEVAESPEVGPLSDEADDGQLETPEPGGGHGAGNLPEGVPPGLASRIIALAKSADSAEPQPWWQNAETVSSNKAATRRFLKGTGIKLTEAAVTALFRLLAIAVSGKDPGGVSAEAALPPAFCAVLQGQGKSDLAAMKDDLEMLVLEGILD